MRPAILRSWNRRMSLRLRIVLVTALAVIPVVAAGGALVLLEVRVELIEAADGVSADRAETVAAMAAIGDLPDELSLHDDDEMVVQVVADGRVVSGTANSGEVPVVASAEAAPDRDRRVFQVDQLPVEESGPFRVTVLGTSTPEGPATVIVVATTEDVEEVIAASAKWGLVALVLLMIPLCGILWVAIGRTLAPVEAIRERADAVSGAELDQRVPETARLDEIGRLARTINAMLDRLEDSADQQRRFLADAAHELRSPVANLRAQLEASQGNGGWAEGADLVPDLLLDTMRMQTLVDELLLLARSDAGMIGRRRTAVDLDDTVDTAFAAVGPEHGRRDVEVDRRAVHPAQVVGDPALLEQVVRNLLDNAVRHADRQVRVALDAPDGHAVLTVDDDGPGIPVQHRQAVFRRFTRLDGSRDREDGGVGLGLAIVADIVRAHGGTVHVADSPTGGARIQVRLPAAGPTVREMPPASLSGATGS